MPFQAWISCSTRDNKSQVYRFNGAMPFQAWISVADWVHRDFLNLLQWGHALSGMDINSSGSCTCRRYKLQWGHALSGMDMGQ